MGGIGAHEAKVADGVLYNHFADKEELIALALKVHVETVMTDAGPSLLVGACHELVLPRTLMGQPAGDFVIPPLFRRGAGHDRP